MKHDIFFAKIETIRRCLHRIEEEFEGNPEHLNNFTKQDSIILNLQRACEAAIDLAMHIVSEQKLGVPQSSREGFDLLAANGLLTTETADKLKRMVGFRNIAVHDYRAIQLPVLQAILERHLTDFNDYISEISKNL